MLDSWQARADAELLVGVPGRGRVLLEAALLLSLVFGETVLALWPAAGAFFVAAELALAMALVRPWARVHGGPAGRALAGALVVLGVLAPAAIEHADFAGGRQLGIGCLAGSVGEGDPPAPGGVVRVESVRARSAADGVLREGDLIFALGGAALERQDPVSDLTHRTHGDELPEDTTVTLVRDHALQELPVHIPRVRRAHPELGRRVAALRELSGRHLVVAAAVRGALVIALLLLLARADGQPLAALGIARLGAMRELAASTWMTAGAFAVQIAVAIPVGLIGIVTGVMKHEATQRTEALGTIAAQGSIAEFLLAVVVAAAFEELAFRGFLVPRMRSVLGSWPVAVAVVSVVFGLGHVYEGPLAVVQTAFLGVYFAVLLLMRRRLLGPTIAHAGFNAAMLLLVRLVLSAGLLDRLKEMAPH